LPELFDDGPAEDEFSIPGDDQRLAAMGADMPADLEPAPEGDTAEPSAPAASEGSEAAAAEEDDEPGEPAESAEQPLALSIDDPEVQAYLEKYDGDPVKALKAATEAQALLGRQGRELGELRAWAEQHLAAEAAPAQPQFDQDALDTWFFENPSRVPDVARDAFYAGNQQLADAALAAWKEIDSRAASAFETEMITQRVRAEIHQEAASREQLAASWHEAAERFAQDHPDLDQLAPKMREIAPQYPGIVQVLQSGDPQSKLEVLDFLYEKARGQSADTLRATAREIAREQAEEATEAIKKAAVASSAAAVPAGRGDDIAARIAADWDTLDAPYAPGEDGWNV